MLDVSDGRRRQRKLRGNVFAAQAPKFSQSLKVPADPRRRTYTSSLIAVIRMTITGLMKYVNRLVSTNWRRAL